MLTHYWVTWAFATVFCIYESCKASGSVVNRKTNHKIDLSNIDFKVLEQHENELKALRKLENQTLETQYAVRSIETTANRLETKVEQVQTQLGNMNRDLRHVKSGVSTVLR